MTKDRDTSNRALSKAANALAASAARDRKRRERGKYEGWNTHAEKRTVAVALAEKLRRASPKTGKRMILCNISHSWALEDIGHLNERGRPFNPRSIGLDHEHHSRRLIP